MYARRVPFLNSIMEFDLRRLLQPPNPRSKPSAKGIVFIIIIIHKKVWNIFETIYFWSYLEIEMYRIVYTIAKRILSAL